MNTYIPPTGTIQMMVGVHLNPKQEDTLYFESAGIRDEFFTSYIYASYDEQSYSRPTRDSVKIQDTADRLYKCQYMRFKNGNAFNGQWIYAFVLAVEYINNNTCQVFYAIDDMITWFPQCTLRECYVEREIPETDNLYENLVPENLETGDYDIHDNTPVELGDSYYCIQSKTTPSGHMSVEYINGAITTIVYGTFPCKRDAYPALEPQMTQLFRYLEGFDERPDDLITIHIVPEWLIKDTGITSLYGARVEEQTFIYDLNPPNYAIKNKKLYSSPYTKLAISNNSGQINIYTPEDFEDATINEGMCRIKFSLCGTYLGSPSMLMYPLNYKGIKDNYDEGVPLTNFPIAPWVCDSYRAYLAQNRASLTTSLLSTVVGGITGGFFGAASGALMASQGSEIIAAAGKAGSISGRYMVAKGEQGIASSIAENGVSAVSGVASTLAKIYDAQMIPKNVTSLSQSDNLQTLMGRSRFDFYKLQPETEMLKIIDDYFSMYGYAQHKVKIPNTHSRPIWNYTKTQGCVVIGDVPASALQNISAIFDRGIRFWKEMAEIGNYEHDNSPR